MLAYNSTWLHALETTREAKRWLESQLISAEQYQALKAAHTTPLYTPNFFVRIGLALFTTIGVNSFAGIFGLIFSFGGSEGIGTWLVTMGLGCVVVLEFSIRKRHLYCAGIDDALLYSSTTLLFGGIILFLDSTDTNYSPLVYASIATPILIAATIRYADRLTALAAYACVLWIVSYPVLHSGSSSQALVPFVLMPASILAYVASIKLARRDAMSSWRKPLTCVEIASLVSFYLAGNYFIVRESTVNLLTMEIPEGGNIPFAPLFYLLTVGIPIAYVVLGLKKRDSVLIRVGLIAAAFSAFTFKYYFSLGYPEFVLTLAGLVLLAIAILAIRYLKTGRNGFTHQRLIASQFENLNVESLVVSQTLGTTPQQPAQEFKPGGGTFGGGGATEKW